MDFVIIHKSDNLRGAFVILDKANSLESAKDKRTVNGDLVCWNLPNYPIVEDSGWLWDWENDKSYAARQIAARWSASNHFQAKAR